MSYIVPGDKPDSCMFCPYNVVDRKHRMTVCKFIPDSYKYDNDLKQYADCPLVEVKTPHGRLIDANKLNIHDISPVNGFCVMGVTEEDIGLADTVIEGEGES